MSIEQLTPNDIWFDGVCKKCGYPVIEMADDGDKDYMNMCLNKECEEHVWHSIYDNDDLDYYKHIWHDEKLLPLKMVKTPDYKA